MDERAARGVPWTILSYAANRAVMVSSTIVLARLLEPADFGLFALATLAISLISIFSGLGLGAALVLRQDLDLRAQGTMLTLLIGAGVVFALLLAAVAPLAADLFREERLTEVLWALAAVLSISGMNWFYESVLQRELAFKRYFVTQFARTVAYVIVALTVALLDGGVWALVAAYFAGHVANTVALLLLTPYRVRPAFDRPFARDALATGRGFILQDGVEFVQMNIDYITIGRVLPSAQLGFYSMAYRQAELPYYAIADPLVRVTFPAYAQMHDRGEDVMPSFLSGLRIVALAILPLGVILSGAAEPFTEALFGSQWTSMIAPLAVLGVWAVVRPLSVVVAWVLNSLGHAAFVGRASLVLLPPLAVALYVAAEASGIVAVAWVMLAHVVVLLVVLSIALQRLTGTSLLRQWTTLQPLAAAAVAAWLLTRGTVELLDGAPPLAALVAASAVALLAYFGAVRVLVPALLGEAVGQARRALSRRAAPAPAA